MSDTKITFKRTEESARQIYTRYPKAQVTRRDIAEAANRALRDKWEAEAPLRVNSKADTFAQFAAHCRKYSALAQLALHTPFDPDAMPDVELEAAA